MLFFWFSNCSKDNFKKLNTKLCNVNKKLKQEISKYAPVAEKIIKTTIKGQLKPTIANPLENFPQKRVEGIKLIDLKGLVNLGKKLKLEKSHQEDFELMSWQKYKNSAELVKPFRKQLQIFTLLSSRERFSVEAEAIVFDTLKDVDKNKKKIKGKIAVFNLNNRNPYGDPEKAGVEFFKAMEFGAVAAFSASVKSLSTFSNMNDSILLTKLKGRPKYNMIPSAYISVEDAMMLSTMQQRKQKISIYMKVLDSYITKKNAASAISEIKGTKSPEKVVVVSSMEFNEVYLGWNIGAILKGLNLKAKRTIRFVGWDTGNNPMLPTEEYKNIDFHLVSANSTGVKQGLKFTGSREAACIFNEIVK